MTTPTLADLRNACGQRETEVQMWELEHGTGPHPEYHERLQAAADAKSALRCEMARITGVYSHETFARENLKP